MPLTAKQMEYLALAWQCFDVEPKIDYEKFRTIANLASAASARETMRVTKKKLKEEYGALNATTTTGTPSPTKKKPSVTPRSTGKRGRGKKAATPVDDDDDDDDDEGGERESPVAKKAKKAASSSASASRAGVVKREPAGEDEDEDGADEPFL